MSAAHATFGTAELLEAILIMLENRQVACLRRVHSGWRDVIDGSPTLMKRLFLKDVDEARKYLVYERELTDTVGLHRRKLTRNPSRPHGLVVAVNPSLKVLGSHFEYRHRFRLLLGYSGMLNHPKESTWRKQFLTRPASTVVWIFGYFSEDDPNANGSGTGSGGRKRIEVCEMVQRSSGVQMGDVQDAWIRAKNLGRQQVVTTSGIVDGSPSNSVGIKSRASGPRIEVAILELAPLVLCLQSCVWDESAAVKGARDDTEAEDQAEAGKKAESAEASEANGNI